MRILLATDGSKHAAEAVEWLAHFPVPSLATVDVVSAEQPPPIASDTTARRPWQQLREHSERIVTDTCQRLAKRWTSVAGRVIDGEPRRAILEAAARDRSDLIVLGARGRGPVSSLLLGSVSLGVARHAPCPVLVCKGAGRPLRAVTVALDDSTGARAAWTFFSRLPLPPDLAVRLIGVVEPIPYPSAPEVLTPALQDALERGQIERRQGLERTLTAAADELRPRVRSVSTVTPIGAPAHMIVREARDRGSDLIVLGARGLGTFERIMLGSVSEAVLQHADCPVLIVRPSRD